MSEAEISVVVPVYNGADFIASTLASVSAQTLAPIEIIVVDDGSTDGSGEIAARVPLVRVVRQENRGAAAARNRGIAEARGDQIAFLDADDQWEPVKLERQHAALRARPEAGYATCLQRLVFDEGRPPPWWIPPQQLAGPVPVWIPSAFLIRRDCLERTGGFNETQSYHEDTDWMIRSREIGYPGLIVPEPLLIRHIHDHNASHREDPTREALARVLVASLARRRAGGRIAEPLRGPVESGS